MNTHRIVIAGIVLLLTPLAAFAATDTWNGGGLTNRVSDDGNWLDNTAPVSDLNNTDLFFGGTRRLMPLVIGTQFAVRSVTFNNTAGEFRIEGTRLTVGAGGITNNDTNNQVLAATVVAGASQTMNAAAGALFFNDLDISAGSTVTLAGSAGHVINNFAGGTGTLTKSGGGILSVTGTGVPINADLVLNAGTTFLSATGTHRVGGAGSIALGSGATLTFSENLTLSGGAQMTKASGATLDLAPGKTLRIESGSNFVGTGNQTISISGGNVTVTGAGSTVHNTNDGLTLNNGSTLLVENGGTASTAGQLNIAGGTLIANGPGASVSAGGAQSHWGTNGTATVTFSNNATGSFRGVFMADGTAGSTANVQVLSGADIVNSLALLVSYFSQSGGSGTLLVSGAGTTWQQQSYPQGVGIGSASGAPGTLTVSDGAVFTDDAGMEIGATGALNLDGGTISVRSTFLNSGKVNLDKGSLTVDDQFRNNGGTVNLNGGALTVSFQFQNNGTLNFNAGALALLGSSNNLTVGAGGLLGQNLTLLGNRALTIGGTTTIDPSRTLTINGGAFRTRTLVNNGMLDFQKGTLAITGPGGFEIGAGALGSNVVLGAGANLSVTNTVIVASGATLILNGGTFIAGALENAGTIRAFAGKAAAGAGTNVSGGRIFISDMLDVAGGLTNQTGARIALEGGTGLIAGAGELTNAGLLTGDGAIAKPLMNSITGEVRGESGRTLYFSGAATNSGLFNIFGGRLDFAGAVTNSATGAINGRGALSFAAGLANQGKMQFSGGPTDIFGNVSFTGGAGGGEMINSGSSNVVTFYGNVAHAGDEIRTSPTNTTVFFGNVIGGGPFTGTGAVRFEGAVMPGSSPAIVNFGGDVQFAPSSRLEIEIGGLTPGTQHDQVNIARQATLDGTLALSLIDGFTPALGDSFTVMTFASRSGVFANIVQPPAIEFQPVYSATELVLRVMQPIDKVWAVDSNGNASVGSNWTGGVAPGGVGDKASFSTVITANRTVTLDVPLTLGTVRFDDDNNYTLAGSPLTLQAAGTTATVIDDLNVNGNGAHTIAAPVVVASNLNINQHSAGALTISGALDNSAGRTITKSGPGTLVLSGEQTHGAGAVLTVSAGAANLNANAGSNSARNLTVNANSTTNFGAGQHLAALNVGTSVTATLTAGGSKNLVTGALTIAGGSTPTGKLDLTNNVGIVDYPTGGPSSAATIRAQILAGRGGPGFGATWTGMGITSSAAATANAADPESRSVGYAENASLPLGPYTIFRGQPVDDTSILIAFTRTADANLDGIVNDDDVTIVGATYARGVAQTSWALGDFDYNGFVDEDDVTLLGVFYDPSAPPLAVSPLGLTDAVAAVPEPSTLGLMAALTAVLGVVSSARRLKKP